MKIRDDIPDFSWSEVLAGFEPDERFYRHMELLQELRDWWKAPIKITSGFRSTKHNEMIILVAAEADRLGFDGIGKYDTFVHLDLRGEKARWDERTV